MLKSDAMVGAGVDTGKLFAGIADLPAIGLAVSGGPDSLALMLLVRAWRDRRGSNLPAVHVYSVDHGLRAEAAVEADFVRQLAERLGFDGTVLRWQGDKPAAGVQATARTVRYALMRDAMRAHGVPVLLTAHHQEDQAETVLMRMAHGSGVTGLAGMSAWSEVEGLRLHRPLLTVPRGTLHAIVTAADVAPFTDPSNLDMKYERTRWRAAFPSLSALGMGPAVINRLAERLGRADEALTVTTDEGQARLVTCDEFGVVSAPLADFSSLHDEIGIRVLSRMLGLAHPDGARRLEQIEFLHAKIGKGDFAGSSLSGCQIARHIDSLIVFREQGRMTADQRVIAAGEKTQWDGRFGIQNFGIEPVLISAATDLRRAQAEAFLGRAIAAPMMAVRAAPLVRNPALEIVALGAFSTAKDIVITQDCAVAGTF